MTEDEIRQVVRQALSDIAPEADWDSIDPEQDLRDQIDLDSVDFLNFVIGLHRKLHVEIPDAEVSELATISQGVAYLRAKLANLAMSTEKK